MRGRARRCRRHSLRHCCNFVGIVTGQPDRANIAAAAAATRLPTIFGYRQLVEAGGLISYGVDLEDCFHRAATFVYKILKGTPIAHLPIEFPTKLELVINLKTAKVLGITVPPSLLGRANEVIE